MRQISVVHSLLYLIAVAFILLCLPGKSAGQTKKLLTKGEYHAILSQGVMDSNRVNAFLNLTYIHANHSTDFDSALVTSRAALELAEQLHLPQKVKSALYYQGLLLFRRDKLTEGLVYLDRLIQSHKKDRELLKLAELYFKMGRYVPGKRQEDIDLKIGYFEHSRGIYRQLGSVRDDLECQLYVTRVYIDQGKLEVAEKRLQEHLVFSRNNGNIVIKNIYLALAEIAMGRFQDGMVLHYYLELLKECDKGGETREIDQWRNHVYKEIAGAYIRIKDYNRAIEMALKGIAVSKKLNDASMYLSQLKRIGDAYDGLGKRDEALELYLTSLKEMPPKNDYEKRMINGMIGNAYLRQNKLSEAEPYFLAMDNASQRISDDSPNYDVVEGMQAVHYINMAEFFYKYGKFEEAEKFLTKFASIRKTPILQGTRVSATYYWMKIKEAQGDYKAAYAYQAQYKLLSDSVTSSGRNKAFDDLMVKYQAEKKDQELLFKQQNIDLLNKQAEIREGNLLREKLATQFEKEQRIQQQQLNALEVKNKERDLQFVRFAAEKKDNEIQLLNQQAEIRESNLANAKLLRNMTVACLILTLIILVLLYYGYRAKKKSNTQLIAQKAEIDRKNQSLGKLVGEKEWLLKELHHRVKNNLHIIMSLLDIQCYYLEGSPALAAIRDTRHRVHSISLIHRKLYLGDNVGLISMEDYIRDLVDELKQGFVTGPQIQFQADVSAISLDAAQAVPLGLILNEGVTNCIKYAFPGGRSGKISIAMKMLADDFVQLQIRDNGIGLPDGFLVEKDGSLGMGMIQGLCGDLDGEFSLQPRPGTTLTVRFKKQGC